MDLWQLRYFVYAAETLNFTKAAKSLHVSQSALSKKMADLEAHFDTQLFLRGKRSLHLTAAGQVFLNESRAILARWDDAFQKVRRAASGSVGDLRIGYTGSYVTKILPNLAKIFRNSHPDIDLHMERGDLQLLSEYLSDGDLDIAFLISNEDVLPSDLAWKIIKQDVLSVVMPGDHPLADRDMIRLSELANEPFVCITRSVNHVFFDSFMGLCARSGFTPNIVAQPKILETVLLHVASGFGISVLSSLADMGTQPNLRIIPLEDAYPVHLFVAWKKDNQNPAIPLFIEKLKVIKAKPE